MLISRWQTDRVTMQRGAALLAAICLAPTVAATPHQNPADADRLMVVGLEFLGEVTFPTGLQFSGTEVGGLSAIAYDAERGVYYALSDDRSEIDPARYYTLSIDLGDGKLDNGDITLLAVTSLLDSSGGVFPPKSLDPEGIAFHPEDDTLFISSEGDASALIDPFVNEFDLSGLQLVELPIPPKYLPTSDRSSGIRNNLAFESLTLTPALDFLYTATENALYQDGPAADVGVESLSRILEFDLGTGEPAREYVYLVEAVPEAPVPPDAFRTNGLVELLALDNNGTLLALERAFSVGKGNTVKLYEVLSQGALDVSSQFDLFWEEEGIPFEIDPLVAKRELLDVAALGVTPDNLEGMALGPTLPDGRKSLILVSDNNFSDTQVTQFLAFALDAVTIPAALPAVETPQALDDAEADSPLRGDSDDPAIWVHPSKPEKSLVIATQKDGGLVVFDLEGQVRQLIAPESYGAFRYNNVDLVYGFELGRKRADIAVVSDRENDTLAVYRIDPRRLVLEDITARRMPASIFGVDDGDYTAYGLATYTSPIDGKSYAFVTQAGGNLVAQLQLLPQPGGRVSAEVVRLLELPVPTGDPEDSQAEGMVVDRERSELFVAMENELGVVKFPAEPGAGGDSELVVSIDEDYLKPDIEGLTIYYGKDQTGYLLVSSQGDSTYAVLDREPPHRYLGSFVIGDRRSGTGRECGDESSGHRKQGPGRGDDHEAHRGACDASIDQVNESDGADVINVPLGRDFPHGLLVVQDGANDPQVVVQDDEELENISTNFKFVPWEEVATAFPIPLRIDPEGYDPRERSYPAGRGHGRGERTED